MIMNTYICRVKINFKKCPVIVWLFVSVRQTNDTTLYVNL